MDKEIKYTIGNKDVTYYLYMMMRDLKEYDRIVIEVLNINDQVGQQVFGEFYNSFLKDISSGEIKACRGCIELIKEMNKHFLLYSISDKDDTIPIIYNRLEKAKKIVELITGFGVDLVSDEVVPTQDGKSKIRLTLEKQGRFRG